MIYHNRHCLVCLTRERPFDYWGGGREEFVSDFQPSSLVLYTGTRLYHYTGLMLMILELV